MIKNPIEHCTYGVFGEDSHSSYNCSSKAQQFRELVARCLNLTIQLNCYDDSDRVEDGQKVWLLCNKFRLTLETSNAVKRS